MWEVHNTSGDVLASGFATEWDAMDWMDEQEMFDETFELAYIDTPVVNL